MLVQYHPSVMYRVPAYQNLRYYQTSHWLHLTLTVLSLGLWSPVWLVVGLYNTIMYYKTVDEIERYEYRTYGRVLLRRYTHL